jgi:hypothetical protein
MFFNVEKCKLLRICRSKPKSTFTYTMYDAALECVDSFKDLGVLITSDLSWGPQVEAIVSKCNRIMGMVKRSVGYSAPPRVTLALYQSLIRSNMEHASSVWAPHYNTHIRRLETIQRSATRYILHYPEHNYPARCSELNILPLSYRREISDLLFLYKCIHGMYNIVIDDYIQYVPTNSGLRSSTSGTLLRSRFAHTETFKHSYFNRVVHTWNALPPEARSCSTFVSFKNVVFNVYREKLYFYNSDIPCTWVSTCRCATCVCNSARF